MLRRLLYLPTHDRTQRAIILFSLSLVLILGLSNQFSVVRAATFPVNSTLDPGDGTCDVTECTLREAINDANAIGGVDTIIFSIGGGGSPQTITLSAALDPITESLTIDGASQTGGAACDAPPITIDGSSIGSAANGLAIVGGNTTISGLTITGFLDNGIDISGATGNNTIQCNTIMSNQGNGVNVVSSSGNRISQNNISSNGGISIALGGGANNNQAEPTLTLAEYDTTNLTVTGSLTSTANTTFDLEYFVCDGPPEAGQLLHTDTVTTNGGGTGAISNSFAATLTSGTQIAVTATDPAGNTSQFSNCLTITEVPVYDSTPAPNSATPINIGSSVVAVGVTRSDTVTISNIGAGDLNVSFSVGGGNFADFNVDTPASIVTPGTPLDVAVTCTPSVVGPRTTTLTVTHDGSGTPVSPVTYELECLGTAGPVPDYESDPPPAPDPLSTINMGSSLIGVTLDVLDVVTISNLGGATLDINSFTISGGNAADFVVVNSPVSIGAGGADENVQVQCTPSAIGLRTTTLIIDTNDTTQPVGGYTYTLECTGDPGTPEYSSNPAVGSPIDIGNTVVGTPITNANALEISNPAGTASLNITGIGLSGGDVADFTLDTPTLGPIVIGGSADISISCNPTVVGTRTTTLTLSHDAATPASPVTYTVNCIGDPPPAPAYTSNPAVGNPITVGNTPVGTPITNATALTITNTGTAALTITGIGLSGGDVAEFTLNTATLAPIAAAGSGSISISCNPTVVGTRTTTLTLSHDAATPPSPVTYTVNCIGDPPPAPAYTSNPAVGSPIDVGTTLVGTPITNATALTITNTGTAALTITGIGLSGGDVAEFTLNTATLAPIAAAGSGSISLSCNPTVVGTRTTTLTLSHDAATPPSPVTYTVNCIGDPPPAPGYASVPAVGNPITVGNTPVGTPITNATALTITNTGTAALTITGIGLSGGDVAEFTLNTATLAPIAAAGSGSISLSCNPTVVGTRTTTLTLSHDAATPPSPVTYTVNCIGDPPPAPGYASVPAVGNPITVGNTPVGTPITNATALTITNTGTAALTITGIGLSGGDVAEFTLDTPTLGPIVIGGSADISISCNPTVVGTRTTTLTLSHDAATPPSPVTYTVNCTGTTGGPIYNSTPAVGSPINVGTTLIGTPITNGTALRITNNGTSPLNITAIGLSGGNVTNFTLNTTTIAPIAPAASANVSISCNPSAAGLRSTTLTVTHNATGSPTTYTVNCTGTTPGVGAYASSPVVPGGTINVGTVQIGTAISFSLNTSNTGTAPIVVGTPSISTANAADFAVFTSLQPQFPYTLNASGSQAITVRCIPSAAGLRQALLTLPISGDPTRASAIYVLQCTGSGTAVITATPIGFVPTATAFVPTVTPVIPANGTVKEVKGLAMRTGPYLGATLIGKAIPGVPYPILAQSNDEGGGITWYLITVDTVTGWVSGLYLNVEGNIVVVPFQGSVFDQIDGAPDVGVTARAMSIIDIRRRPSGRAAILTQVPQDGIVRLLGRTRQNGGDFWVQINYNGVIGWIPAAPIAVNGSTANVPIR